MHIIKSPEYRVMPWKNGGGTTTELYVCPGEATAFDWRVSIATVEKDGPFSTFTGCERHIMVLSGKGMKLEMERQDEVILQPRKPFSFSGGAKVTGVLLEGPVQDFNLIVHQKFATGELRVMDFDPGEKIGFGGGPQFFYLLEGTCSFGNVWLNPNDSFWLDKGELVPLMTGIRAVVCNITPR